MNSIVFSALFFPVVLSGLSIFIFKPKSNYLKLLTTFSGAYLLGISFLDIIPEIYTADKTMTIGLFVILGFFIQLLLDFITKGIEHGHDHALTHDSHTKHLSITPIMIGICIHSFLEGMPLAENFVNPQLRNTMLTGIIIHNIPISIVLMGLLFLKCPQNKTKALLLLFVFALSAPLGTIASYYVGAELISQYAHFFDYVLAMVVGIFLHISTTILFETDENHRFNFQKFFVIVLGFGATILLTILLH
ncbi:MAG: ZIP family metal transporter [Bacteroidota bacterium]